MSSAEPRLHVRAPAASAEPVGDEMVHGPEPAGLSAEASRASLRLVRRPPRRRPNRRPLLVSSIVASLGVVAMGLVALHVLIAENQFRLDHLQQRASAQQATYEKLRLTVAELEAPSRIVSVAQGPLGMQQPGSVTYLHAKSAHPGGPAQLPEASVVTATRTAGTPSATRPAGTAGSASTAGTSSATGTASTSVPAALSAASSATAGVVRAPEGDANWPAVKPFLSGSP
ncbi:MAG: hypothetical protein ACRDZX_08970 [Acidimicrobiales bacterium]